MKAQVAAGHYHVFRTRERNDAGIDGIECVFGKTEIDNVKHPLSGGARRI